MLTLTNVQIVYDNTIEAVREASLALGQQQIVALLGANGAGKSTTLKAISGVLYPEDGEVKGGQITFEGQPLTGMTPDRIVRAGVVMVPEGRRLFDQLTVEENLLMGGYTRSVAESKLGLERVYATFPRLTPKRTTVSGYLSGGEQQMVAIGRALMSAPKLLMLDEPTLGLAPQICEEIFAIVTRLCRQDGVSILLVEQNAQMALSIADYRLHHGKRPRRPRRPGRQDAAQRRRARVLPWLRRGRLAQEHARSQALQAPQALAVMSHLRRSH
jgi:branched-chain amino acid transport system ATP-binding protein